MNAELVSKATLVNSIMKGSNSDYRAAVLLESAGQFLKAEHKFLTGIMPKDRHAFFMNFAINVLTFKSIEDCELKELAKATAKLVLAILDDFDDTAIQHLLGELRELVGVDFDKELAKWCSLHEFILKDVELEVKQDV